MDSSKEKEKKGNLILKTWERCKSIGSGSKRASGLMRTQTTRTKSLPRCNSYNIKKPESSSKPRVVPEGCFSVYVGPQKQRFVIKTECANHPLFKILLEEAESEYGFNSEGPLVLPCNVDVFYKVLLAMAEDATGHENGRVCGFAKGYGSYHLLTPPPVIAISPF
ncbi:Auxin_inducible domain-containing protein [Cephalotus follicularis]|uniref:Auxin_inducible domain-containing protein n=1 Tax=Cephalotus follicularis TaxID=3775 RepID=A0A1Q3DER5_CEPFO|nr:Auxin_inducible domain-containing protein [Cephalotus follicularis]